MAIKIISGGIESPAKQMPATPPTQSAESPIEKTARLGTMTAARAGESVLGLPADIANFLGGSLYKIIQKATGVGGPSFEESQQMIQQAMQGSAPALPTSSQLRSATSKVTGGYTEPQTKGEQTYGDVVSILSNILATEGLGYAPKILEKAGKLGKFAYQVGRATGTEEIGKALEGHPVLSPTAQMIFLGATHLPAARTKVIQTKDALYNAADKISEGATVDASGLFNKVGKIYDTVKKSGAKGAEHVEKQIKAIGDSIVGGKISIDDVKRLKRELNEWIYEGNLGKYQKEYLKEARNLLNEQLETYNKINPEHAQVWNTAEELHKGLTNHSFVTQTLSDASSFSPKNWQTKVLFGLPGYILGGKVGTLAAGGTAKLGSTIGKIVDLVTQSKAARNIYGDIFKNAARADAAAIIKDANKLDKVITHEKQKPQKPGKNKIRIISGGIS